MPGMEHADHAAHGDQPCRSCPVCMLIEAVGSSRPEVAGHLRAAGRELSLAMRAALEAMPEDPDASDRPDGRLRRINLDDRP